MTGFSVLAFAVGVVVRTRVVFQGVHTGCTYIYFFCFLQIQMPWETVVSLERHTGLHILFLSVNKTSMQG